MTDEAAANPFIHLRVHTAYSLTEGAIRNADLVELCRRNKMPAVAVTDTANLFGALEFAGTAAKAGVQPIVGCLLPVAVEKPAEHEAHSQTMGRNGVFRDPERLLVLAQNETGYANLMRLVSAAYLEADAALAPYLTLDQVEQQCDGLIALTGSLDGTVGRLLKDGQDADARILIERLASAFDGRLYIELQRHGVAEHGLAEHGLAEHGLADEAAIEEKLIDLAYALDLPLVATNDVYFADESFYDAHDALLCIADGAYVSQTERRRVTPQHHFKTAEEMAALFADLPEAIANTSVIARRCAIMPVARDPILPPFPTRPGLSEAEQLEQRVGRDSRRGGSGERKPSPRSRPTSWSSESGSWSS